MNKKGEMSMKKNMNPIDYAYKQLASAIVYQAIIDYVESKDNPKGSIIRRRIERFIRSPWYAELTDIDPDLLLDRLQSGDIDIEIGLEIEEVV